MHARADHGVMKARKVAMSEACKLMLRFVFAQAQNMPHADVYWTVLAYLLLKAWYAECFALKCGH